MRNVWNALGSVVSGMQLGTLGTTGKSNGHHLHITVGSNSHPRDLMHPPIIPNLGYTDKPVYSNFKYEYDPIYFINYIMRNRRP